jgi:hypothetical protein
MSRSADIHWLLSFRVAGQIYRYTTAYQSVDVTDARSGEVFTFDPGLTDPAPTLETAGVDGIEIPIEVFMGADTRAVSQLKDHGGLSAELAMWREGDDWERREVWADGRCDRPVYETIGDPVAFSIIEVPWEDRSQIPAPSQIVSGDTWPVNTGVIADDNCVGQYYPYIFGSPGVVRSDDSFTEYYGWPVLLVEIDETWLNNFHGGAADAVVLVAGHKMVATTAKLYNRTTKLSATVSLTFTVDKMNQPVTIATVAGSTLEISQGDELWMGCIDTVHGGIAGPAGDVLRGAGEMVRWLIERSTIRYDMSRFPMLSRLDPFKFDFFINAPVTAWSIIADTILGNAGDLLPCYWQRGSGGLFLAVWPWETVSAAPSFPVVEIDPATRGGARNGPVTSSSSGDLRTDLVLSYAKDEANNNLRRRIAYAPIPTPGAIVNPYLAVRYARATESRGLQPRNIRQTETIECGCVQDPATAALLLDLAARLRSVTRRSMAYLVPPDPRLIPGREAILTDDDPDQGVDITALRCRIVSVQRPSEGAFWLVTLEELPDWLRAMGPAAG